MEEVDMQCDVFCVMVFERDFFYSECFFDLSKFSGLNFN